MFIARQPIFTKELHVFGYELLYRASVHQQTAVGSMTDMDKTLDVFMGTLLSEKDKLTSGKRAFINFDEEAIMNLEVSLLGPENLILEILETVEATEELMEQLRRLKSSGFTIALDDFTSSLDTSPFLPYVDIIKVDVPFVSREDLGKIIEVGKLHNKTILAEKVETKEDFEYYKSIGVDLFQGYFFEKPMITQRLPAKSSHALQCMQLLSELSNREPDVQKLTTIIEQDSLLSYKLFRFGSRNQEEGMYAVRQAIMHIGLSALEKLVGMLLIQESSEGKPKEILRLSLIRAHFAEEISVMLGKRNFKRSAAIMGLFSTLEALLDQPFEEIFKGVKVGVEIKNALCKETGPLADILRIIKSYEHQTSSLPVLAESQEEKLFLAYEKAISWSDEVLSSL